MSRDGPLYQRLSRMIDSALDDLAAGRDRWSRPRLLTSTAADLTELNGRLAEDAADLADTRVGEIRDQLIDILGPEAYAMVLAISPEDRSGIAEYVAVEESGDPCAMELHFMDGGAVSFNLAGTLPLDGGFGYARLPLPFPYLIAWALAQVADVQEERLTRAAYDDLRAGGSAWPAVAAAEPAGMVVSLREAGLALLARPGGPAALRRELAEVVGDHTVSRMLDDDRPIRPVRDWRRWQQCLPPPLPEWPTLILSMAGSAAGRFGPDETLVVLRAAVADIADGRDTWDRLAVAGSGSRFWTARLVADGLLAVSPPEVRARIRTWAGRRCPGKLAAAPDEDLRPLAFRLTEKVQQDIWWSQGEEATESDIVADLGDLAGQWCAGTLWSF